MHAASLKRDSLLHGSCKALHAVWKGCWDYGKVLSTEVALLKEDDIGRCCDLSSLFIEFLSHEVSFASPFDYKILQLKSEFILNTIFSML